MLRSLCGDSGCARMVPLRTVVREYVIPFTFCFDTISCTRVHMLSHRIIVTDADDHIYPTQTTEHSSSHKFTPTTEHSTHLCTVIFNLSLACFAPAYTSWSSRNPLCTLIQAFNALTSVNFDALQTVHGNFDIAGSVHTHLYEQMN